jgi:uncharacterized Fe-S cluster protein YjdI
MTENDRKYSNEEITVYWKPNLCNHSEICFRSLPRVFNPKRRPWIKVDAAESKKIMEVVDNCPTGALSYDDKKAVKKDSPTNAKSTQIKLIKDGPIMISGDFKIINSEGIELNITGKVALCRCGASTKMPYCDGKHREIDFKA